MNRTVVASPRPVPPLNSPNTIAAPPRPPQDHREDRELTVGLYEKQAKIYPRAVTGWFARWRWTMVWVTQLVFFVTPWLRWNGRQAVLFDLAERRFYVLGLLLQPQDLIYLAALLVMAALALFLFTAVAGRLWCGYACPQTVYTEIFLWIERRIEGDRQARMKLDAAAWGLAKVARKTGKHASWLALGLFTGFTFVGYFTPIRELARATASFALSPWEWFWVLFYGLATYGNAGYLREQVCKYMCPYARFQSTLIDDDSLIIAFDTARGEPRGARSRKADPKAMGLGDCIDCTLCVQVCPTGIDIRKGLQNECIGCAACIDVCNDVMGKMSYAPGLIRYSTAGDMAAGGRRGPVLRKVLRPRVLVYGLALLAVSGGFIASLSVRIPFTVDIVKDRRVMARVQDDGRIENVYSLHVSNLAEEPREYHLAVSGLPGLRIVSSPRIVVDAVRSRSWPVEVALDATESTAFAGRAHTIVFELSATEAGRTRSRSARTTFYVPK